MPRTHDLDASVVHNVWDNTLPPRLEIEPGDTIVMRCRDAVDGVVGRDATAADLARAPIRGHPLTGPIRVRGARPGDVLRVDVLALEPGAIGWTTFRPGAGLLAADFDEPYLKVWDLERGYAELRAGVRVPLAPFLGVMGVALPEPGAHPTAPPRKNGGNLDVKHLIAGSTLFLPVWVEGALFSAGDGHAAQGDGEVCITAIETSMTATLRLSLERTRRIAWPELETTVPPRAAPERYHATTGIGPDLMEAARDAVRAMLAYLVAVHGLTREEAYVLASVACDLKINEIVDAPNWVVGAFLPLSVFV